MKSAKDLRQELGETLTASRAIVERAETEKRAKTAEEVAELKRMNAAMDVLEEDIKTADALERREAAVSQPTSKGIRPEIRGQESDEQARADAEEIRKRYPKFGAHIARRMASEPTASRAYRSAFDRWLCSPVGSGVRALSPEEQRALSVGTASEGGYTVPGEEFLAELLKTVDDLTVIRGLSRTFQVTQAQSLGVPTLSADPADPDWTSELSTGSEDSTMAFGKRELRPWPLAKRIKVSDKLLRASPLGMEGIVRDRLAYKAAIAQSKAFNTGSGVNEPLGVYTPDASGIPTSRDTDVSTSNAVDPDKLIAARYTLRPGYWPNARWHLHRNILSEFRQLKSDLAQGGNYLWQPGLTVGAPNTLLDFPYVVDEYAPSATTGTGIYIAILGDFQYYWVVDALGIAIKRLDELYAESNQVGFIIRMETDAQPVLSDAFVRCKATLT